jgi:signal transduction histidine kinase
VIDLGAWCRCWLANWAEHSRAGDIVFQAGAGEFAARIHPSLFGQVLDNLLDNACKYSAVGTPIVVSIEAGAGEVTLAVTDRGCGISSDELHLVFQPFYRSSQARWTGTPGVGLGLTIVQRLTAILGGKLDVESELGQGSRFCVSLPRAPSASTTALTETAGVVGCPG